MKTTETKSAANKQVPLAKTKNYSPYFHSYTERDILDTDEDRIMQYYASMIDKKQPGTLLSAVGTPTGKRSWQKDENR